MEVYLLLYSDVEGGFTCDQQREPQHGRNYYVDHTYKSFGFQNKNMLLKWNLTYCNISIVMWKFGFF